ncbi:hypothetical protein [Jeotgalibacillus proteolyticus]|uniref:Uncharacterized protein n=1 Tax=Jeotgalibacillus proteolyticus TaxID=2082395 RepID=A0A2S5GHC7_9BACL|nr:hypothetical protein [Jeotgalibacillus proteolyticus]PPA72324.1 hypothetical protein C4B60_02815 [Jeotgalibacillus proteolyticus]
MRNWIGSILLILVFGAFVLQLCALLNAFPILLSSIILFFVLFLFVVWLTSKSRFKGFSTYSKRKS